MSLYLLNTALSERAASFVCPELLLEGELYVVDAVAPRFAESNPDVLLALAFAVRAPRVGDVGVNLARLPERVQGVTGEQLVAWPADLLKWQQAALASPMVGSAADVDRPFVSQRLSDGRVLLFTRRMWREQERLAIAMLKRVAAEPTRVVPASIMERGVMTLFGDRESQGAMAVIAAASRCLTVVTGGPGTGKTYSIKRLLALLVESTERSGHPLCVELAAPTGKAAVRMAEAIAEGLDQMDVPQRVRDALSSYRPKTLHRLLRMGMDGRARHNLETPILADLVIVDEVSMVDIAMMRRLFEAIAPGARLVLLGDRDQLASVEAGTVLSDIVGPVLDQPDGVGGPLSAAVVPFLTNHRFAHAPTVASIARALQARGDEEVSQVRRWMTGEAHVADESMPDRVLHLGVPVLGRPTAEQLQALAAPYLAESGVIGLLVSELRRVGVRARTLTEPDFHLSLLKALERYRVLAVHRRGALGVEGLERALVKRAQRALGDALSEHAGRRVSLRLQGSHWLGRPIMITRNAYDVGLMNGDIGLVLQSQEGLVAVFEQKVDGVSQTRQLSLSRLPQHMGALAMTVHKSQGSQFQRVAMVLAGQDSPIQTRELIYTAITRSSERLDWLGDPEELERALRRRVGRSSGLSELIWSRPEAPI